MFSDLIMSDLTSFDETNPVCDLIIEEWMNDQLFDNYFCRICGHSKDEHMCTWMHRNFKMIDHRTISILFIYRCSHWQWRFLLFTTRRRDWTRIISKYIQWFYKSFNLLEFISFPILKSIHRGRLIIPVQHPGLTIKPQMIIFQA